MTLAEKLYSLRRKNGLSQEQLAQELNVSRQAISKWEAGQSVPESEKLLMLSRYFRVSLDYLMKDEQTEEENGTPAGGSTPPQNGRKTRLPGAVISLSGILGLIVWGILSILLPPVTDSLQASSTIRIDGNGIFLILCVGAIAFGAGLLLKNNRQ